MKTKQVTGWWASRFGNYEVKLKSRPNEAIIVLNIPIREKGLGNYLYDKSTLVELSEIYQRQGECNQCGKCCEGCRYYLGDGVCTIYNHRPQGCIDYPTPKDFLKGLPSECSYRFVKW